VNRRQRIVAGSILLALVVAGVMASGLGVHAFAAAATPSPTPSPPPVSPGTRALNYLFAALCIALITSRSSASLASRSFVSGKP
jgi:hypothetical protein